MKSHPKVLLLCSFSQSKANGITIHNLFKTWPKGSVAVAEFTDAIDAIYVPEISNYYTLGAKEVSFLWPFCYLKKVRTSASYKLDEAPEKRKEQKVRRGGLLAKARALLASLQVGFLQKTGLAMISRRFRISKDFEAWVREFNPDVIYASTGDICKLGFISEMAEHFDKKCVLHIFDDYINSRHEGTLFPGYWKRRLDGAFRATLDATHLHLSIGDKMSAEYAQKYGKDFYGFHNPIDPELWISEPETTEHQECADAPFTFVYAGKINRDTVAPLIDVIEAIDRLNAGGECNLKLKVYSPYPFDEIYRLLGERAHSVYEGKLPYGELPDAFRNADALLLPLDFTEATIRYIRLSMLTKATEYMISGSPIFVYAPANVAVTEYLSEHKAGYISSDPQKLDTSILGFIRDAEARVSIGRNAFNRAKEHHLLEGVNDRLRALIVQTLES